MDIIDYFPAAYRASLTPALFREAEEIRLRVGQPIEILYADESRVCGRLTAEQMRETLNYLSGYCLYALEEELRQGYFTLEGGHRVGVSGRASVRRRADGNETEPLTFINGLNIRLAHEKKGCAAELLPWLYQGEQVYTTMLFSPPGAGKTTCLRDCIRLLSSGSRLLPPKKVGVVDERSELAACCRGIPQNDMGPRTDVLDNCPKEQGMRMLLRSMSPQVIAVDELGMPEEFAAVQDCARCGVSVIGTIHAGSLEEVRARLAANGMKGLLSSMRLVGIKKEQGVRHMQVFTGGGRLLWEN